MTTLTADPRLDRIADQLDAVTAELAALRAERARWSELATDLTPILTRGLEAGAERLGDLELDTRDFGELGAALIEALPAITALVRAIGPLSELAGTAAPLLEPAVKVSTARLTDLEDRGYFDFASGTLGVLDRVVTSFDRTDLEALGDNVVLILQTVRDMTQPEVMTMLRRTFSTVTEDDIGEPPGTLALLRELRDPGVRRGLSKVLHTLRTLGDDPAGDPTDQRR